MKTFLKYALLACVVVPFVLPDRAMGGEWQWGDNEYLSDIERGVWVAVYYKDKGKWVWRNQYQTAPDGRNQRVPPKPSDRLLPTTPPPPKPGDQDTYVPPQPYRQPQPTYQPQPTWTPSESGTRGYSGNKSRKFSLEPGDVILTVNGEDIFGRKSLIYAVNNSPQTMEFTVRDRRNGQIRHFTTTLASSGYRLGIYCADHPDGARVTSVMSNSAARRCYLVD